MEIKWGEGGALPPPHKDLKAPDNVAEVATPILNREKPEIPALTAKASGIVQESMWEEMERFPVDVGFIRRYKLKSRYDDVSSQKNQERISKQASLSFPATEFSGIQLLILKEGITLEELKDAYKPYADLNDAALKELLKWGEMLRSLGYKSFVGEDNAFYVDFPDVRCLNALWKKQHPDLPPLNLQSSKGIATHKEFIEGFLKGIVFVSDDVEFVHDQTLHVMSKIKLLLCDKPLKLEEEVVLVNFLAEIENYHKLIERAQELKIDERKIKTMETFVSALVDNMAAISNRDVLIQRARISNPLKNIVFADSHWQKYLQKECGIEGNELNKFLKEFKKLVTTGS